MKWKIDKENDEKRKELIKPFDEEYDKINKEYEIEKSKCDEEINKYRADFSTPIVGKIIEYFLHDELRKAIQNRLKVDDKYQRLLSGNRWRLNNVLNKYDSRLESIHRMFEEHENDEGIFWCEYIGEKPTCPKFGESIQPCYYCE